MNWFTFAVSAIESLWTLFKTAPGATTLIAHNQNTLNSVTSAAQEAGAITPEVASLVTAAGAAAAAVDPAASATINAAEGAVNTAASAVQQISKAVEAIAGSAPKS